MDLTGVAAAFTILTSADTSFDILSIPSALMLYLSILSCCTFSFASSCSICPASSTARSSNCSTSAFSFRASTFNCIFSCLYSIVFSLILSACSSRLSTFRIAVLYSGKVRLSRLILCSLSHKLGSSPSAPALRYCFRTESTLRFLL